MVSLLACSMITIVCCKTIVVEVIVYCSRNLLY
uniref:Uncharacterized protein n=1 Tax=Lepeophtheirus salmonis TaxID=72036 RepID=A0A0K2TWF3_LEPSM